MKIIELRAENIKRLVAVSIKPDGNLVEITGRNGAGKTSVLDAIWWALEGKENIQAAPIRKGATEAMIRLDLGEIKVTRTFKSKDGGYTTSIVVEQADGARFPSPQTMLDKLLGELSFDPLAFTRMKPRDQFETLKRFVPGVDFDEMAAADRADYDMRTDVNRRAKELRAQIAGIQVPQDAPTTVVDEAALVEALDAAGRNNAEIEARKLRREQAEADAQRWRDEADGLARQADDLRAQAKRLDEQATQLRADADGTVEKLSSAPALPDPVDTATIRSQIEAARQQNAAYERAARAREELERLKGEAEQFEGRSKELTSAMEERAEARRVAIATAKMPVDGLGFGDSIITLDGVPFEQASDAEQLRASIAVAAAMNPELRVIRVRDGSLLDEGGVKLLADFADEHDMQIWIERVDSSGRVGFVIEDGQLKVEQGEAAA
jgi:DNA repair exonuclease SbcCD ATPase subunit